MPVADIKLAGVDHLVHPGEKRFLGFGLKDQAALGGNGYVAVNGIDPFAFPVETDNGVAGMNRLFKNNDALDSRPRPLHADGDAGRPCPYDDNFC